MEALFEETWHRPFPRLPFGWQELEGKLTLLAEDEDAVGMAVADLLPNGVAHLNVIYVRSRAAAPGLARELLAELATRARAAGGDHVTLDVDTTNEAGRAIWQRLGFREWGPRLSTPLDELERRLGPAEAGESRASLHVQTDDVDAVKAAVAKYLPRLGGSGGNCDRAAQGLDDGRRRSPRPRPARARPARPRSSRTQPRRSSARWRSRTAARPLRALRARLGRRRVPVGTRVLRAGPARRRRRARPRTPTVVARLTGADPARLRAVARTASSPDELPPAPGAAAAARRADGLRATLKPVPTLYTAERCPYAARARIALAEKGLDYDAVEIDLDDRPAWLYDKNPLGRVPVYEEEGGLVLPESWVIMEYLEERYPEPALLPADPAERALARLWSSASTIGSAAPTTPCAVASARDVLDAKLELLDRALEGQAYLSGREYGLADIAYVPWILRAVERFEVELAPALPGWLERLLAPPRDRGRARGRRRAVTGDASAASSTRTGFRSGSASPISSRRLPRPERAPARPRARLDPARARLAAAARRPGDAPRARGRDPAAARAARRHRRGASRPLRPRRLRRGRRVRAGRAARRAPARGGARAGDRRLAGELEPGAVELQKTKVSLEPRPEAVPTWQELLDRLDDPALTILDVRTPEEYTGRGGSPCDPRQGHIPGARQLEPGGSSPGPAARCRRSRSASSSACPRAPRSSRTATRARAPRSPRSPSARAGYDARNYPGSWHEWSRHDELPLNAEGPPAGAPQQFASAA